MEHLGVELHCPYRLLGAGKGGVLHVLSTADNLEIAWDGGDGVTMTHPHLRTLLESLEQRVVEIDSLEVGTSILARVGLFYLTTQCIADKLGSVADTQHRYTSNKLRQVDLERLRIVH